MVKYHFLQRAVDDLADIWTYTLEQWSERQADTYYKLLVEACDDLARGRVSGKNYDDITSGLRGLKVGRHIIFYRAADNDIEILRFLHESMDLSSRMA